MIDYDTNYNSIYCPFCNIMITSHNNYEGEIRELNEDFEEDFFQCPSCEKYFKVKLSICKTLDYMISKPTKEEIKKHNLLNNKEEPVEDVPGQTFIWCLKKPLPFVGEDESDNKTQSKIE